MTRRRRRVASRRVRRTIKKVDPLSVLKIAILFYLIMFVVWLVLVAFAFNVLDATGLFSTIEDAVGPEGFALEGEDFEITLGVIEKWAFLFGLISVLVASVSTLLGAILYNIAADLFGGVEITFVEREL
ncbi:MAG: hypothetical protein GEU78_04705 [Actinobacteria bacterium]|nr:hypothetical protein [Actinomycetota bacterium]